MQATAERTEAELQARLAEVNAGIAAGAGDVLALLEEREGLQLAVQAAAIARQQRADAAYRAKIEARRENYLREVNTELAHIWRLLPELRWYLLGLRLLEQRTDELGRGSWEDVTGLPHGAADRLCTAIAQALTGTRLGEELAPPGSEVSTPNVAPWPERTVRVVDRHSFNVFRAPIE